MKRHLTLRREALAGLSSDDLGGVVGGYRYTGDTARISCGIDDCRGDVGRPIATLLCQPTVDVNRCPTLLC